MKKFGAGGVHVLRCKNRDATQRALGLTRGPDAVCFGQVQTASIR